MTDKMVRSAKVYVQEQFAGTITETEDGEYIFVYDDAYLGSGGPAVSLTLPVRSEPYRSRVLMPFFDGLITEGWMLEQIIHNWKLDRRDRFGILLSACRDCVGDVSVIPEVQE